MKTAYIETLVRRGYKPWSTIDGKELVSYPWLEGELILVNARNVPGDFSTMRTYAITDEGKLKYYCNPTEGW